MSVQLRSDRIQILDCRQFNGGCPDELWQLFRNTAVEPGQAPAPDFISFVDECLLCARIVVNEPVPPEPPQTTCAREARADPPSPPPSTASFLPPYQKDGLIYLHAGPANFPAGEANIGVIMKDGKRCHGYAREAVQLVVRWAFEELQFHRVQAAILDTPFRDRALRLFIGSGFSYEGTKRRAVFLPEGEGRGGVWKDVTYLAMLDTEWALRTMRRRDHPALERPVSVWDEMFARHSKEREELLRWEESHGRMTRTSSTETLRENPSAAPARDLAYLTDDTSSICGSSLASSPPSSPPPEVVVTWEDDAEMAEADVFGIDECSHRWEDVVETTLAARRQRQDMRASLLAPSPLGRLLALPSIASTGISSEGNVQSPLTIPSPSSAESTPPSSPSPSPPYARSSWTDSEDEANLLATSPTDVATRHAMRHHPYPHPRTSPASLRSSRPRSGSVSSTSTDSWSDAQSSASGSSSTWDLISNASDRSRRRRHE